ncbi:MULTISPECIES: hypothetical protein [Streptosporangium]|uniref:DUF916 domain-containing protein n=1 Tax=Streptosporangium brasiliense TaxID=47480 RepID=A0ABT9QYG2_9ACTN|nr:hypothetical protein [Streptosporangium brasiliense]MDP9861652.1 hypothetical protein [Streptosporangium brasiliense]
MTVWPRRGRAAVLAGAFLLWAVGPAGPLAVGPAGAGSAPPTPGTDFSLTVSPTRLAVQPGDIDEKQRFQVVNQGERPVDVEVRKADFKPDLDGTLLFQPKAPYSASNWVTVTPDRFRLPAGRTRSVSVRISVPSAPEPGDHQLALIFMVPAGTGAGNIRVNRGIGAPVYIAVPGPVDDSAEVTGLRAPGFALGGPLTFTTTVRDTGTVHRDFRGDDRLRLRVNGESVAFPDFTVGRGAIREISTTFDPPLWCLCRAAVSIPGPGGTPTAATATVVVLPLHWLAAVVLTAAGLYLLARHARRRYRAQVRAAAHALSGADGGGGRPTV